MYEWESLIFSLPKFWTRDEMWRAALDEATGMERRLIEIQRRFSSLLRLADGRRVSPALVAWIALWTRGFQVAEGARGAYERRSLMTLRVLTRVGFELTWQLAAIARPLQPSDVRLSSDLQGERARQRLEAYAAWALHHDRGFWENVLRGRRIEQLFDPKPARAYARDAQKLGGLREFFELGIGEIELEGDFEAEEEMRDVRRGAEHRVAFFDDLLRDARLRSWVSRLQRDRPRTFFGLIDEDRDSMIRELEAEGVKFLAPAYDRGSGVIHGSTLEGILWFFWPAFGPQVGATDETIETEARSPAWAAWQACLWLYSLRPERLGY